MNTTKIINANIVNEGHIQQADVLIEGAFISRIEADLSSVATDNTYDAQGKHLLPGLIDDQVHFREPGLTHKATIYSEAKAAVAGGITSFMEMPNTVPNALTQKLLQDKYDTAAQHSLANYSFYMGVSNDNLEEVLQTNTQQVCGLKVFMGSSTGNMLVDNEQTLRNVFAQSPMLVATHCEDEATIRANMQQFREQYGEEVPIRCHPDIRSEEACYKSSSLAVSLAKEFGTRLHVLHISTAKELSLFSNDIPLEEKRITAEACLHHLWFNDQDYSEKGTFIKWNPAVKTAQDQAAILEAVINHTIDVLATDHAPHTLSEKQQTYFKAPSGGPLVQHHLVALLEMHHQGKITLEKIVEKACHHPAQLFEVDRRGFIREGHYADLVLVDLNRPWTVQTDNILYLCGWSPFEDTTFQSQVTHTFISGHCAYANGQFDESQRGLRLEFRREAN
ncbi:dihydroorotase [Tunicatimonas pelagia]|uniref:dihydroorotase n=1 Tax=Tunicatimonas pelagia TaxID=931531 RepID=UPI00266607D2|nr:dihydroorotase [Tunicatimonas pelagia]WKN45544.1 dihydroorotase [Tunicatimonas pelagia]